MSVLLLDTKQEMSTLDPMCIFRPPRYEIYVDGEDDLIPWETTDILRNQIHVSFVSERHKEYLKVFKHTL